MPESIDDLMERASQALAKLAYLDCEALCINALSLAREAHDWSNYARILLPLQETRRQRRIIANEGHLRLGTADLEGPHDDWLGGFDAGCLVVTHPFTRDQAAAIAFTVNQQHRSIEVLYVDNPIDVRPWTICSFAEPSISVERAAPPLDWINRWLSPDEVQALTSPGPDVWFMDAAEALGNAALAQVSAPLGDLERIVQLEAMLRVVPDHEILHQQLGRAARAMGQST